MSTPDPYVSHDAAYVLGALSPQDRAAYEAHLLECDRCAHAVRELAGMPGLLGRLGPAQAAPAVPGPVPGPPGGPGTEAPAPPASLLPALLDRVATERRRRRRTAGSVLALALAACLALLAVLVIPGEEPPGDDGPRTAPIAMTSLVEYPVEATVRLDALSEGTRVDMDCRYGKGGDDGDGGDDEGGYDEGGYDGETRTYVLVAITREGETEELASWVTVPDHHVSLSVGTELPRGEIGTLEVRSAQGYPVLRAVLPP